MKAEGGETSLSIAWLEPAQDLGRGVQGREMAQEDIRMKQTWHLSPAASRSSPHRGSDLPER